MLNTICHVFHPSPQRNVSSLNVFKWENFCSLALCVMSVSMCERMNECCRSITDGYYSCQTPGAAAAESQPTLVRHLCTALPVSSVLMCWW